MPAISSSPETRAEALRFKTRLFALIVVLSNVAGDAALRKAWIKPATSAIPPSLSSRFYSTRGVALGVSLLIIWTLSHMTLLSWADLSYVAPVTAIGYVLNTLAGRFLLGEAVPASHWGGVILITIGVVLASYTSPSTVKRGPPSSMKWFLVMVVVFTAAIGDLFRAIGMKHNGEIDDFRPGALSKLFGGLAQNKYVVASICSMAISFFAFIKLLAVAPLSFAVPATGVNIILETVLARFILKECVDYRRWVGVALVAGGVFLLAQ